MKLQAVGVVLVVLFASGTLGGAAWETLPQQKSLVPDGGQQETETQGSSKPSKAKLMSNTEPRTDGPQSKRQQVSGNINQQQEDGIWWWITAVGGWITALITFFLMYRQNQAAWIEAESAREQLRLSKIARLSFEDWRIENFVPGTESMLFHTVHNTGTHVAVLTGQCVLPKLCSNKEKKPPPVPEYRDLIVSPIAHQVINLGRPTTYKFLVEPVDTLFHAALKNGMGTMYIVVCVEYVDGTRKNGTYVTHRIGFMLRHDPQSGEITQVGDAGYNYNAYYENK